MIMSSTVRGFVIIEHQSKVASKLEVDIIGGFEIIFHQK